MSGQYREDLAREIRAELGAFDDENKPVIHLVRYLVARLKIAENFIVDDKEFYRATIKRLDAGQTPSSAAREPQEQK